MVQLGDNGNSLGDDALSKGVTVVSEKQFKFYAYFKYCAKRNF